MDELFGRLNSPRQAEVDSEIILRPVDDPIRDGRIDVRFKEHLALCKRRMSAVASKLDPRNVLMIKCNTQPELRYHPKHNVVVYAFDPAYLDVALASEVGWNTVVTKPMRIMRFNIDNPHRLSITMSLLADLL